MTRCYCPDLDADEDGTCACGHVADEHDDTGECTVDMSMWDEVDDQ